LERIHIDQARGWVLLLLQVVLQGTAFFHIWVYACCDWLQATLLNRSITAVFIVLLIVSSRLSGSWHSSSSSSSRDCQSRPQLTGEVSRRHTHHTHHYTIFGSSNASIPRCHKQGVI
jgi:hypothetical protein